MKLNLALLQLLPGASLAEQNRIGIEACREAKKLGADLALFPEMWSCGYVIPEDPDALQALAVSQDSEFIQSFGRLARELDMAVGITYLERYEPAPRNTLTLFDRHGSPVLTYAKVHTCDFGDEARLTPGDEFCTVLLDTAKGPVRVGAMICYDREFPESARILMLQGAELILTPNACPMEINRLCQLRARAFENMLAIATANYPAGQPDCNGHSTVFDGVPWLPDAPEVRDM
ncbi:MAG: carbon-nitrogen hydrolase family protein, partial [Oscillospiraceae bacterium]|nr:carbon-nitrogen hydrolase family protein [Oscillospiraceae bacterium]